MRNFLCLALCLITSLLSAQTVDSVALRRVDSLIQVSRTLSSKRDFDKALEVNAAAEKLALEKIGRESAAYGSCCFNRGRIMFFKGDNLESEPWYLESKAIREKVLGREHPDYAASLNNLAGVYRNMGQYEKAEPLYIESKAIREKALGKEHPLYAASLGNLAIFYYDLGQYEKAEALYHECKDIWEKVAGRKHLDYGQSLHNLAILYDIMGQYEKAEPLYIESKAIREKTLGREHPDYAESLNDLASLYKDIGQYKKAEPLHLEAKAIREKTLGREHPAYAQSLEGLANVYLEMGQYKKAESLYLESKAIREKALGRNHPGYAISLFNLAIFYFVMGEYKKAEPLYLESKAIREKALGRDHPDYAASLYSLAGLYREMGQYGKVELFLLEQSTVNKHLIEQALHHLSESELNDYLDKFSNSQNETLSFTQIANSKKMIPVCYDNSLFYKGFLLQSLGRIKRMSLSNPAAAENFNLLKSYERRLANQYAKPIADRDIAAVATLESKANDLEKDLARTVAGFGQAMRQVKWQEVQRALKPGEAAIEFVSYRFFQKKQTDSTLYAALVLLPSEDSPKFVPLFEEKQLTTLLKTEGNPKDTSFYNSLYSAAKKGDQLYDLIWKPIAAALPQGTTIYCSPSGLLHRLNLGAIPTSDGKTISEKYRLTTLGSTRQLVVPPVSIATPSATAQLYGGIQYDGTPVVTANTTAKPDEMGGKRGPDITQNDSTLRGENWNYLRWTEVEISAAANVMKSKGIVPTLKKGTEATEESFKALGQGSPSPRVLHLATHGFFFPDPKESKPNEGQAIGEKAFKVSDNPMIRSGLVLAGGNHAWKTGKPLRPDLEDGILTAYEISQMNLANTELVVLSACETGLGDLVGNEGVYGLQRAFKIAGARYLIMSLWQVPDFQTQVFMTAFYKHWLERRMAVPEAFRATQAELRGKYSGEAFKWAGFVLVE